MSDNKIKPGVMMTVTGPTILEWENGYPVDDDACMGVVMANPGHDIDTVYSPEMEIKIITPTYKASMDWYGTVRMNQPQLTFEDDVDLDIIDGLSADLIVHDDIPKDSFIGRCEYCGQKHTITEIRCSYCNGTL